jgi:hypothetical protein
LPISCAKAKSANAPATSSTATSTTRITAFSPASSAAFARKKRDADGFQLSVDEIVQKAREALNLGITELHIVGGLHPSLPFSYYTEMLRALKSLMRGCN